MPVVGFLLIILGVLAGIMPFLGQMVGLGPEAQVFATEDQLLRHAAPAAAIDVGGILVLPALRPLRILGGLFAMAGAGWLIVAPTVLAWATGDLRLAEMYWALGAYYATGFVVAFLAGLAFGVPGGKWIAERRMRAVAEPVPADRAPEEEPVEDRAPDEDGARRRRRRRAPVAADHEERREREAERMEADRERT
jgi:hypothetical protein